MRARVSGDQDTDNDQDTDKWYVQFGICRLRAMNYLEKNSVFETARNISSNNRMHADSKKRRSFLALLFAAADAQR